MKQKFESLNLSKFEKSAITINAQKSLLGGSGEKMSSDNRGGTDYADKTTDSGGTRWDNVHWVENDQKGTWQANGHHL